MTDSSSASTLLGGVALLERAVGYTLGSLTLVTPGAMSRPTPCSGWDLRALLTHLSDSLAALQEATDVGAVELDPPSTMGPARDPVQVLRDRACRMLGGWAREGVTEGVEVGGLPIPSSLVTGAGALEIAVHGWDVTMACGGGRTLPESLAEDLLACAFVFVLDADRPHRFAPEVAVSPWASAADRLLGHLGRRA